MVSEIQITGNGQTVRILMDSLRENERLNFIATAPTDVVERLTSFYGDERVSVPNSWQEDVVALMHSVAVMAAATSGGGRTVSRMEIDEAMRRARRSPLDPARVDIEAVRFGEVTARNAQEASFLRNVEATFREGSPYNNAIRYGDDIVIQRAFPWDATNVEFAFRGTSPWAQNGAGVWEPLTLHHIGRETGKVIEIPRSYNRFGADGGPLHIPGPGSPVRFNSSQYWYDRVQTAIERGQIPQSVLDQARQNIRNRP